VLRRRFFVSILVLVVLTGAALLLVRLLAPPADKQLNVGGFFQIKVGMSLSEVERLLGGPPGNYGRYSEETGSMTLEGYLAPPGSGEKVWCNDENRFEIYFDQQKQVVGYHKRARYSQEPGPSWLERLRKWLGRGLVHVSPLARSLTGRRP
jgi:hypothetical protein